MTQLEADLLSLRGQLITDDQLLTMCILPLISRKFGEQAQWRLDRGDTSTLSRDMVSRMQEREPWLKMIFQVIFRPHERVKAYYHRVKEVAGIEEMGMLWNFLFHTIVNTELLL